MEYNLKDKIQIRITYQIIDSFPNAIRTSIPLIDIPVVGLYFITAPFYIFLRTIINKESIKGLFNRKKEFINGKEKSYSINFSLDDLPELKDEDKIVRTENVYIEKDEAKKIVAQLKDAGYDIDSLELSSFFTVKRKTEEVKSSTHLDEKIRILYSCPEYANTLAKVFYIKQLKKLLLNKH